MRYAATRGAVTPGLLTHRKHIASQGRWERRNLTAPGNCASFSWGDARPFCLTEGERHLWTVAPTDPYLGRRAQGFIRPINVIRWSKPGVQDKLNFFMHGSGETDWRILPAADQDYRKQVTAWDRREFTGARGARRTEWWCPQGRPDHSSSCELMQIACASARGLLSVPREVGPLFEHAALLPSPMAQD